MVPENRVGGIAEDAAKDASAGRVGGSGAEKAGKLFDERGAVGADGGEELGMAEGEVERAIASHGDAGNGAVGAAGSGAVTFFDEREKFLEEEIFVAVFAVLGVDVKTGTAVRRGDQKTFQLAFFAEVFDEVPGAGVDEELFVVAESVEGIEDGKVFRLVSVVGRRKHDAVGNVAGEDFAGNGIAFDAAGCGSGSGDQ